MEIVFELTNEYIELIKLLKLTNLCATGGEAKIVVTEGMVEVDGQLEYRKKRKIRSGQTVSFDQYTILVK